MSTTEDIERRIEAIERRNSKVEADNDWEGSWFRKILVALLLIYQLPFIFSIFCKQTLG